MVLATSAVASACGGGGSSSSSGAPGGATSSTAAPTTAAVPSTAGGTTVPATELTLHITDLHLVNSEDADNGVRVLLPAGVANASVTLSGLPTPNQVISVCQANALDTRFTAAACRTPANGDAVTVALGSAASGVEIAPVGVTNAGAAGNAITLGEVTIRYTASTRQVSARLPQIASGDAGGRPTFALTPAGPGGSYQAMLAWSVIQVFGGTASTGRLELLQAGNVAGQAESSGQQVQLTGNLTAPVGDAAVRVQNVGSGAMVSPKLVLLLP